MESQAGTVGAPRLTARRGRQHKPRRRIGPVVLDPVPRNTVSEGMDQHNDMTESRDGLGGASSADSNTASPSRLRVDELEVDRETAAADDDVADGSVGGLTDRTVEYYKMLCYFVASEPAGELSSDQAEELLEFLHGLDTTRHHELLDVFAVDAVVAIMQRGTEIVETQILACFACRTLLGTTRGEKELLQKGLVPELVHSYTNHASVDEFIELHCILMILISEIASGSDAGKRALIDGDAPSVVLGVLRGLENDLHSHVDTVKWACMAAAFLLDGDVEAQRIFLANGIIPILVKCIASASERDTIDSVRCSVALLALRHVLQLPPARASFITEDGPDVSIRVVVDALATHRDNAEVHEHGVVVLLTLVAGSSDTARLGELACLRRAGVTEALEVTATNPPHHAGHLASQARDGLAQLSEGVLGYAYHSLLSRVSAWQV
eukprot:m.57223 g.57223  ORF g.57223 m.57223 type:complete len:439 (+) comp7740_c0_seq1:2439-3755(+)